MKRRRLLLGAGTLLGAGGTLGSGAFTSVSADRSVSVEVADDADALLTMEPSSGPNGEYATADGGTIALEFADTDAGGSGVGTDSVYQFDDVFRITNRGTQPVYVWATFAGASGNFTPDGSDTDIYLYPNGDSDDRLRDSDDDVLYLGVGQSAGIGVYIDSTDVTEDQSLTMTVNADAENPASGAVVGGGGTAILGPTNGLVSYWSLDEVGDGTAVDTVGPGTGSIEGGGVTTDKGRVGAAAKFDPTDGYIQADRVPAVTAPFSLSVWLNAAGFDQTKYPLAVSKWQRAQNRDYLIGYNGPEGKLYTQFNKEPDGNKTTLFGPRPSTDTWYHCVLTYAEDTIGRFYVNGSERDSAKGAFNDTSSKFVIGSKNGGGNPWHGRVDDVRIYDRALSPAEVTTLYQQTGGGGGP
jgi:hypothetical protein